MNNTGYETELSDEEKRLLREIEQTQGYGGTGGAVGTAIGGGLGALGFLGGPAVAGITVPAGMAIGGSLGGLLGTQMGQSQAEKAMERLQKLQEAREKPAVEKAAQHEAFQRLLGRYNKYGV
jgi:hypothetical protein